MEKTIEIGDLPPEQARLVREFVEFLKMRYLPVPPSAEQTGRDQPDFAAWPLGVRGHLTRDEIYEPAE